MTAENGWLFEELVEPEVPPEATTEERFIAFHRANPAVFAEIIRHARRDLEAGIRGSLKYYFERIRRDYHLRVKRPKPRADQPEWKLPNTFTALYARLLVSYDPAFLPNLEIRARRNEDPEDVANGTFAAFYAELIGEWFERHSWRTADHLRGG
jgi:hypothetical protein